MGNVRYINQDINLLLNYCVQGDRAAQKKLFEIFSPGLLSICRQYINDIYQAEDVMITAFTKIFNKLSLYEKKGDFEAWIRRIAINECISHLRSNKTVLYNSEEIQNVADISSVDNKVIHDDYQNIIDTLPLGCKMVFNLYVIDGYRHQEIAEMLQISEGTSKSQLAYARKILQTLIQNENNKSHGRFF